VNATTALNRALSKLGILSRARATEAIRAGRVRVDGRIVTQPLHPVVPERVRIDVDDAPQARAAWRTLAFHKPRGIVTTSRDPQDRRTIYDVLGEAGQGLAAVGRLDLATSGLLVMTNDTQLANWMTDPANAVPRVYLVTVRGGMQTPLPGVTIRKRSKRETHLVVELRQGRNREVRKMFESVGHEVMRLKRVRFGGLELGDLRAGEWRALTRTDVRDAFPGAATQRSATRS
jgi:16S rRNA U516 pseudouridylate synthase RsuA-like enzyme